MKMITKAELKAMNDREHEDFVLINVLARKAFNEQHIRTSINIPQQEEGFPAAVEKVAGSKIRKIVVYCANFDCPASTSAANKLEQAGFTSVYDYKGGTEDWLGSQQQEKAA